MPTAIIIGFEYEKNTLPGAIVDLYLAYRWCRSFDCQIYILTDIKSANIDDLNGAINENIADANIMSFYEDNIEVIIRTEDDFRRALTLNIIDSKLIVYYSGHGVKDSMILPDQSLFPFVHFRNLILGNLDDSVEIFWILDCCNPNGMYLPFKLNNNSFMLSSYKVEYVTQKILLITSSEINEKSIATKLGSLFSRNLFYLLTKMNMKYFDLRSLDQNRNLRRLIGNLASSIRTMHTGYTQTISIYSSYVMDPVLWLWIGTIRDYKITLDETLKR